MWSVRTEFGLGEQPKVVLRCTSSSGEVQHAAEVYLFGATVTSYVHCGDEKIFVSPLALFNGVKAIRGGVPLVFPQFGQSLATMPQHGFARTKPWAVSGVSCDEHSASAEFSLNHDEQTLAVWPHRFELRYNVSLSTECLKCRLQIRCMDDAPFECQTLLHTYFKINDINSLSVTGFEGLAYTDKTRGGETFSETDIEKAVTGEVDRVYIEGAAGRIPDVRLRYANDKLVRLVKGAALMSSAGEEPVATDVVFWNPWEEKARALADMVDDGFQRFVCVEPGAVHGWTEVSKEKQLVLFQEIYPS